MNIIFDTISRLFGQVLFWVMVEPWEQAIRVRAGKHVRRLAPGFHWRVPVLDVVYKQSSRWRTSLVATQTLSTADGHTVMVGATLGYVIADVQKLYETLHHAEDTLTHVAAAAIAEVVLGTLRDELMPSLVSEKVQSALAETLQAYGVGAVTVRVSDFAFVRAFRLVQDQRWSAGRVLSTERSDL